MEHKHKKHYDQKNVIKETIEQVVEHVMEEIQHEQKSHSAVAVENVMYLDWFLSN